MKATDLMIGDYIQDLAGDLCQVIVLDRQVAQVETLTGVHQGDTTRYLHEAEGVTITPEILEKNGFRYMGEEYPFEDYYEGFGLHIYGGNFGDGHSDWHINCGTNVAMDVTYVHRLQHALKLCGIEKEITL